MSRDVQPRVGFSDPRRRYLVEWYRLDLEDDALGDVVSALDESAARIAADGSPVELVAMLAAPSDEVVFGVFAADSADVVAETCDRANFPAQRLTAGYDACDRTRAESVDHQSRAHARRSEAAHRSPD